MARQYDEIFQRLAEKGGRYHREAYSFTHEALSLTLAEHSGRGPLTGRELCEGIRRHAEKSFGYLSKTVFAHWGVTKTDDFGAIVVDMMNAGLLEPRSEAREEFADQFDFAEVFEKQLIYE